MPPRSAEMKGDHNSYHHENSPLTNAHMSFGPGDLDDDDNNSRRDEKKNRWSSPLHWALLGSSILFFGLYLRERSHNHNGRSSSSAPSHIENVESGLASPSDSTENNDPKMRATGPYQLLQCQEGEEFFDYYDFYDGDDSVGSAGYNRYVSDHRAFQLGIAKVTLEEQQPPSTSKSNRSSATTTTTRGQTTTKESFVYMASTPTTRGPRESVRLEGRTLFNRGLFILDLRHMPAGCGVWPAFWLTNEEHWPDYGEVDIVEGINNQTQAKTALHTSSMCDMYAHVPEYNRTGVWDRASGIPDTFTGNMDFETSMPADNCWNDAPHQWQNQGCVTVAKDEGTIGVPLNQAGGGIYALEWDPEHRYIRSWVFPRSQTAPTNLERAIETAHYADKQQQRIRPDPQTWGLPYAYFAIGPTTGCSADHFRDMRIVFNLAFCGNVAGNRFGRDCPVEAKQFAAANSNNNNNNYNNPILSCNAYIQSQPDALKEAYWKIRGVYVYEREMELVQ